MGRKLLAKVLVECDVPNGNGRTYPKAVIEKALGKLPNHLFVTMDHNPDELTTGKISLENVAGTVDHVRLDNNLLLADITILDTPKGVALEPLLDIMSFRLAGVGTIDRDGVVSDYTIIAVMATNNPA